MIASESTYGAKKISAEERAPAQRPVEQQRDAERERELQDEREPTRIALCRIASRNTGSPNASR